MAELLTCSTCKAPIEKVHRPGPELLYFCRPCKKLHDEYGNPVHTAKTLTNEFNPLQMAREQVKRTSKVSSAPAKTALEIAMHDTIMRAYQQGLKDGVLLAYSQDDNKGDYMEKLGVANKDLLPELQARFTEIKEAQKQSGLSKEASAELNMELQAIKEKIDAINSAE